MNLSGYRAYVCVFNDRRRDYSELDEINLKNTFERMGAKVDFVTPEKSKIKQKMDECKRTDFTNVLYVAFVYGSHGGEDGLATTVDTSQNIIKTQMSIIIPLCKIKSLHGKLKLLIMQTCRGDYDFLQEQAEGPEDEEFSQKYCAKLFATTEGTRSYRVEGIGSLFIYSLCNNLKDFERRDLMSIMESTMDDVQELCKKFKFSFSQRPAAEVNFGSLKFYFTDGFRSD